jgi:hypothetical protein
MFLKDASGLGRAIRDWVWQRADKGFDIEHSLEILSLTALALLLAVICADASHL